MSVSIYATAIEASRGANLKGYVAVVTGGSSGIGLETVNALVYCGARVYMGSRSIPKGQKLADGINAKNYPGEVLVLQLDLADLNSVHNFAKEFKRRESALHFLVLNAGLVQQTRKETKQGFEYQFGVNHFAHVALIQDFIDLMVHQRQRGRIVFVSSDAYLGGSINLNDLNVKNGPFYVGMKVYSDTKLANLLTVKALAQKLKKSQLKVYAVHPGAVKTNFFSNVPFMDVLIGLIPGFVDFILNRLSLSEYKTPAQGAASTIYALTAPEVEDQSGAYIRNCRVSTPFWWGRDMGMADKLWKKTVLMLKDAEAKS